MRYSAIRADYCTIPWWRPHNFCPVPRWCFDWRHKNTTRKPQAWSLKRPFYRQNPFLFFSSSTLAPTLHIVLSPQHCRTDHCSCPKTQFQLHLSVSLACPQTAHLPPRPTLYNVAIEGSVDLCDIVACRYRSSPPFREVLNG